MRYIIEQICEIIVEKQPDTNDEAIVLVNGFEQLNYYAELAAALEKHYIGSNYSINIKLAKKKWDELSTSSSAGSQDIQMMEQHGWVADKESVTFYRNQHNVDILVLLGTEDEEDTGGLANCFQITPDSLLARLDGAYHKIFRKCFTSDLETGAQQCVDKAYKSLFEYVPADICKLSNLADKWNGTFNTINEFCEEFGKSLQSWGIPNRINVPLKPSDFNKTRNILHDEREFISGKLFQRLSQKKYSGLQKKIAEYETNGRYAGNGTNWLAYGLDDYGEFSKVLLEFARGENVAQNRLRLLKVDYAIIDDVLKLKISDTKKDRISDKSVTGDPLTVMLSAALFALQDAKRNDKTEIAKICFHFKEASIVTGYTDVDDIEKKELLVEVWKNICVHVNGIFEFINQNEWKAFGNSIDITCDTEDFFSPQEAENKTNSVVSVSTGTNTLNKIMFDVSVLDNYGNLLSNHKENINKLMDYHYTWKFSSDAAWLFDFKDIVSEKSFIDIGAKHVPIGVMKCAKNTTVIRSEEEFFDLYGEESVDFSFDLEKNISKWLKNAEYNIKSYIILFANLGEAFCKFVYEISEKGFYNCVCGDVITNFYQRYTEIANSILQYKFSENEEWIKDAYLQAFAILDSANYIENEDDPECVIIPPWHPVAIQKIKDQKRFLIDGLSQKIAEADEKNSLINITNLIEHFTQMTKIQSAIDLFPTKGNDYMGVLGTFGNFCVYGNEKNTALVRTRIKDVLRKEAIYDEEFKASELTQMNDDAKMLYDVLLDYNKAMPSVRRSLNIVFLNPPELQPIISAISKYTKDIRLEDETAAINMKLFILVRPENKGGKNYLTYWMDEYFAEDKNTNVRIYMNEWSDYNELCKLMPENSDIVFNMDLLHAASFHFISNSGKTISKITDCRFPIVYKPSPLSKKSTKRKIELTQTQFSTAFKYSQVVRYKKISEKAPKEEEYLAVRETSVDERTKMVIDMLHTKSYWVVCIDKVMDGALLRDKKGESPYNIIGFSTGKGMYGQYNLTITARNSILETVERKLRDRLKRLFKWQDTDINTAVQMVMREARGLDGISLLSAVNQKSTNIHEFMAYVLTSLREKKIESDSALKVIIHLDSYKHWFDNSEKDDNSKRPDFLLLSVASNGESLRLQAEILECKTALYKNADQHIEKAIEQVEHGLKQLKSLFEPKSTSIERRYWFAQLYRALVFAQVTFSDNSEEFFELSGRLRTILDGNFEIEWSGSILGYWIDMLGDKEEINDIHGITVHHIPQQCIQELLLNKSNATYVDIDEKIMDAVDDEIGAVIKKKAEEEIEKERQAIIDRKKIKERIQLVAYPKTVVEVDFSSQNQKRTEVDDNSVQSEFGKMEEGGEIASNMQPQCDESKDENQESLLEPTLAVSNVNTEEGESRVDAVLNGSLKDVRVLIGKDRNSNDVCWEFGHKGLSNRHLLITGTSGQGKTYCIQTMLYELSKTNISMVVFDYTEGFRRDQLEKKFIDKMSDRMDEQVIYFTGVPINPFKRHEIEIAGMKAPEKISDVAQRIASTLTHVYDFGEQQFAAIYEACSSGLSKYGEQMNMKYLESELNASTNKAAKTVVSKMLPFLHSVEFSGTQCDWGDILYNTSGKLTIFQLTSFVRDIQVIITEFMLWDMWHYTKKNGSKDKPFAVVLDEAQNLSHADNSPSGMILTEGRKFGWSAWYATQSLKVLNDDEVTRLMQAAFKLYFKPTDSEIIPMAKQLNPNDANEWRSPLSNLKKGECIVIGDRIQRDGIFKSSRPTLTHVTAFEER